MKLNRKARRMMASLRRKRFRALCKMGTTYSREAPELAKDWGDYYVQCAYRAWHSKTITSAQAKHFGCKT